MGLSPSNVQSRKMVRLGTPDNEQVGVDVDKEDVTGGFGSRK